jgi:hypothetical protein
MLYSVSQNKTIFISQTASLTGIRWFTSWIPLTLQNDRSLIWWLKYYTTILRLTMTYTVLLFWCTTDQNKLFLVVFRQKWLTMTKAVLLFWCAAGLNVPLPFLSWYVLKDLQINNLHSISRFVLYISTSISYHMQDSFEILTFNCQWSTI